MSTIRESPHLLEDLLDQMIHISVPMLEVNDSVQNSMLLELPSNILKLIMTYLPLRERLLSVGTVCRRLRECVKSTITMVEFYKDGLDHLVDNRLMYFISLHRENIKSLNFDLFRSSYIEQCTQWTWRQSVVSCISMCPSLERLSVLVCNRHRLRDNDLIKIFKQAPLLKSLSVDAQFLKGHCLQHLPHRLERLEMELCTRIPPCAVKNIMNLKYLKVLSLSQLLCLSDSIMEKLSTNLHKLQELALVLHGEDLNLPDLSSRGLASIARLEELKNLSLEGFPQVTDIFLQKITDTGNSLHKSVKSISIAFCTNISSIGLQYLSRFPLLTDLNIEGCNKRDLSDGLVSLAKGTQLTRLLVSENSSVSNVGLLRAVDVSPRLRLLDITGNPNFFTLEFAITLVNILNSGKRLKLTILTDTYIPWNLITHPNPISPSIEVIHVLPAVIPPLQVVPNSVLSFDGPSQLPSGILSAKLRRGIRCRFLSTALSFSDDEKENSPYKMEQYAPGSAFNNPCIMSNDDKSEHSALEQSCESDSTFSGYTQMVDCFSFNADKISLQTATSYNISSTTGNDYKSGGAPRPPIVIPEQPTVQYTRGPRSKRRSAKLKIHTEQEICFTESDFPPLGST